MEKTGSSAVYNINYHLVWCPKYRKKILIGNLKEFLDSEIQEIADTMNWKILEMRVMPDHIHLFVSCDPLTSPT
ncbi:MAG: IS200/IS605 family transposase [Nitrosarchaeum sp.]